MQQGESSSSPVVRASLDPHIELALSMTARPGSTAVLTGAGLSVGAGVPAAWEVQRKLLEEAAQMDGANTDDPFVWWRNKTDEDATYDAVLEAIAPTRSGRMDKLRTFFEPTAQERERDLKVPSPAHRALARLVKDGWVHLVVTLNFDHLIETALRDVGITPTVVSTPADVAGMEPLHAQRCLVWHLHGDYTNPAMLNTRDELRAYDETVRARLAELFDQYGLLIVGWSAQWDTALRESLASCPSRRYTTFWLDRAELKNHGADLAAARGARQVTADADGWLEQVANACEVVKLRTTDPLSTAAEVAAAKRDLAAGRIPAGAHDRLQDEATRLRGLDILKPDDLLMGMSTDDQRIGILQTEHDLWIRLIAVLAYWGDDETDRWWTDEITRFADIPLLGGNVAAIESLRTPAVAAMYAGGVAAAARGRWGLISKLMTSVRARVPNSQPPEYLPVVDALGPRFVFPHEPSRSLSQWLLPLLSDAIGLGPAAVEEGWERFEYLLYAQAVRQRAAGNTSNATTVPHLRVEEVLTEVGDRYPAVVSPFFHADERVQAELRFAFADPTRDGSTIDGSLAGQNLYAAFDKADEEIQQAAIRVAGGRMSLPRRWYLDALS